jgi:predicted enzyme related to lactoylglutathione lyase
LVGYEREHAPGTPSWTDLTSPDLVISARFYGGLLGWDTALRGPAELTGGYLTFQLDGADVAGLGRLVDGDDPPAWTTYFAVRDVDEVREAVDDNGGTTMVPPVDVLEMGRRALFTDPTGAVFGVWQPEGHEGADLVGVSGAMCWNQLASRNIEAAKRFYGKVFEWEGMTTPYETSTYTTFRLDGREIVGMVEMDRSWPRGLPSHWMTYFGVADCDAMAERAVELGGEVSVEPYDVPQIGRAAVIGDPHGAVFSIVTPNEHLSGLAGRPGDEVEVDASTEADEKSADEVEEETEDDVDDDVAAVIGKRKSA